MGQQQHQDQGNKLPDLVVGFTTSKRVLGYANIIHDGVTVDEDEHRYVPDEALAIAVQALEKIRRGKSSVTMAAQADKALEDIKAMRT